MADIELNQIRMRLSSDQDVLAALHNKRQFHKDADGEYISVVFNSQELRFHRDDVKTLGRDVAHSIYRRSWVNVGDDLTGELKAIFDIVEEFSLAQASGAKYACPVCGKDQKTGKKLSEHLLTHEVPEDEGDRLASLEDQAVAETVDAKPAVKPEGTKYFSRRARANGSDTNEAASD